MENKCKEIIQLSKDILALKDEIKYDDSKALINTSLDNVLSTLKTTKKFMIKEINYGLKGID